MAAKKPITPIVESVDDTTSTSNHTLFQNMIDANKALQGSLQSELQSVNKAMNQNRAKADSLVYQLLLLKGSSSVPSIKNDSQVNHFPNANTTPNRRWTKRFFVDHKGSEPRPNQDTLRRRNIEQKSFFYHTQPPWLSKESDDLLSIVAQHIVEHQKTHHNQHPPPQQNRGDTDNIVTTNDESTQPVDFQLIAEILNRRHDHGSIVRRNSGRTTSQQSVRHQRSAKECEIQYRMEKSRNSRKLLFNDVRERTALEQAVDSMLSAVGLANMDWDNIAEEVCAAVPATYRYTALDCLFAYHTKLKTPSAHLQTTSSSWTREEDELLLKFIAAAGPQAVIDSKNTLVQSTLCTQLLPHKSKKQIFTRVNHSLLNPNMQRNDWSDYEERRLPICMKIYYTPNPQDGFQLYCASTHCYGRSTKSVVDKWNRSINPAYTTKPFTNEEDEELLKVMRSVLGNHNEIDDAQKQLQHIGWVELSQTFFPHRHPQRLQSRWSELATDQDIINREKARLAAENNVVITNTTEESTDKTRHQRRKRQRSVVK